MHHVLSLPEAKVAIWLAVLASLLAVGIYVVGKVRAGFDGGKPESSEMLTSFRELHSQGELSDEEYRNIKTKLAGRLQREVTNDAIDGAIDRASQEKPENPK